MSHRLAKRILLVGWDGADWQMIRPLIARGEMPTLARLVSDGASGNLATIQPVLSPMLWNSIATGKRADKHGIAGFVEPLPDRSGIRPASSTSRRCKALWNILTQSGLRTNVVSWFASHPAEPIRGAVVTDRYVAAAGRPEPAAFPAGTFYPVRLQDALEPLVVRPTDLDAEALLPFVPLAARIDQSRDDRLTTLASLIAQTSTVHAAACRLAAQRDWDLTAVYYGGIDQWGHHFMQYQAPQLAGVSDDDAQIFGEVMTGCYKFHDMMLEAILAHAGPETTVLLVSDHGFHHAEARPSANALERPETWHRQFGVACACGPGVQRGVPLYGATLLDVTPTILAMLGLPIGDDMDGRPWLEILEHGATADRIESWETLPGDAGLHDAELREDPAEAAEMVAQLVALGYVDPPAADVETTIQNVLRDCRINMAVAVSSSRRAAEALALWQELVDQYPDDSGLKLQLASCFLRLGHTARCEEILDSLDPSLRDSSYVQLMLASVAALQGRMADARKLAIQVAQDPTLDAPLLNRAGDVLLKTSAFEEAQAVFTRSLRLVEDNPLALDGLATLHLATGHFESAAADSLQAVGLVHYFPAAHFHLGEALVGLGRETEAIAAYETCLGMGYEPATTHGRLAKLYRHRNPLRATQHQNRAAC